MAFSEAVFIPSTARTARQMFIEIVSESAVPTALEALVDASADPASVRRGIAAAAVDGPVSTLPHDSIP